MALEKKASRPCYTLQLVSSKEEKEFAQVCTNGLNLFWLIYQTQHEKRFPEGVSLHFIITTINVTRIKGSLLALKHLQQKSKSLQKLTFVLMKFQHKTGL